MSDRRILRRPPLPLIVENRKEAIMATVNTNTTQAHDAQVIVGIQKHLLSVPSLPLAGSTYTPADLVKLVQSRIDSAGVVAAAGANKHATVVAHTALGTTLTPVLRGLRQYVLNAFGETSPVLADFGFTPPKKRTLTPEKKAAAALLAKATRKARHTVGKKQKLAIKGAVSPAAPANPPASASAPTAVAPTAPATPPTGGASGHSPQ
jgi:hypothetical protein